MRRIGAVLFWLGLVLTIAGAAVGFFGGARAVDAVRTAVDEARPMPGGTATVQLETGDRRTIYERTESQTPSASCEVLAPDGTTSRLTRSVELDGALGESSYINVGEFEAASAGAYTVTCTGAPTVIGPSLDFGNLGSGALGLLGGVLGVGLGLTLMLIGAILWLVGRSRDKNAALRPGSGSYETGSYPAGPYRGSSGGRPPPPPPSG